jgi:membrane associated rhomboid family serine protease
MASHSRFGGFSRGGGLHLGGLLPFGIKWLLITNSILFVLYFLATVWAITPLLAIFRALSLIPKWVMFGALWQPLTYQFLHSPYGFSHILFNMLMLWMFGAGIERDWGTKRFLQFYLFCGAGAGLCDVVARLFVGDLSTPTIGASGAIYGVLLAFGLLYPHQTVYFWMIFPIPARVFVLIMGVMQFLLTMGSSGSQVSHIAHLGGMLFGYIYLRSKPKFLDIDWLMAYRQWRLRRARKKFEVYMRKRDGGQGGGWVN